MIQHLDQPLVEHVCGHMHSEEAAIEDALRLAKGMTYKNAAAGLNLRWWKNSYYRDPEKIKTKKCSVH